MSNRKQSPFEDFDWLDIQKKYADALNAFNTPKPSMDSVWVNAMDDWWKSAKPKSQFEGANIFEKVLDQCRNYYYMSEQFSNLVEGINKLKSNNENITAFINGKFKDIDSSFFDGSNTFNWNSFAGNFTPPTDFIKSAFSDPSAFSDIMSKFSNAMPNSSIPGMDNIAEQFLSSPGLGYSREAQDKVKLAIKLWTDYQQNYQEYQSVMARLNQDALELMRKRILEMSTNGEDISNIRQVYDLWIDSNEKVYAEYVYTEEYAELNGRLVNSMMAYKKQSQEITEDALSAMNLPTTSSVDELARRHYELRKQMKAMQSEINDLKKQLQQKSSKSEVVRKQAKPATKRKKKVKKTTTSNASSNVIEIKQTKKKSTAKSKPARKKEKQESKKSSADKGMIELKF